MASYADGIIRTESAGNPLARNPRSSAGGLGQFLDSTWLAVIKKHRPDVAAGKTREQILQLKFDPNLSREMTAAYEADNAAFLQSRGVPPTAGSLKLAHFAGPQGAVALYSNPDAPVESVLGADAVRANPFLRGKRGADVVAWADRQMSGASKSPSQAMAANLQRRFAPKTEGGASTTIAGGGGQGAVAGGQGMDQLKSALGGKSYDPGRIDAYGDLVKTGQDVASKATNWQQALLGTVTAGVGGYLQDQEKGSKKEFDAALMGAVAGAQNPVEVAQILIQSPDERMKAAGLELLTKNLGQAPQSREIDLGYGRKAREDFINGQWVRQGGGAGPSAQPQSASVGGGQPAALPSPAPQPQGVPAPAPGVQNIGEVGPGPQEIAAMQPNSFAGQVSNVAAKGDMLPIGGGQPGGSPAPAPVGAAPAAPQYIIGEAVPKPPEGFVHKLAPDGAGYLYRPDGQPVFEPKSAMDERSKSQATVDAADASKLRVAEQVAGGLQLLERLPVDFGKQAFERAIGPYSADDAAGGEDEKVGVSVLGTGFSIPSPGRSIARANAELERLFQGGGAPTEVRDRIETEVKNLAAVMKPLVRSPGEGAWSDKDQANLEKQIGALTRSRDTEEYRRRLNDIRENITKTFAIPVPIKAALPRRADAPKTAEEDVTGWETYRKKYLGY